MSLACNMVLKKAVDSLLCSMCHVHPSYFSLLMSWMGVVPSSAAQSQSRHRLSLTDDGKKQHDAAAAATSSAGGGLTDDSKHARSPPALSESQLATLAAASQSPGAIQQLLDSGLPSLLVRSLAGLCCNLLASADLPLPSATSSSSPSSSAQAGSSSSSPSERRQQHHHHHHHSYHNLPSTSSCSPLSSSPSSSSSPPPPSRAALSPELAAPVLRFLTEVGNSHAMKDWLGGPEVNPLWTALLFLLCHSSASAGANSPSLNSSNGTAATTTSSSTGSSSNGQASTSTSAAGASAAGPSSSLPSSSVSAGSSAPPCSSSSAQASGSRYSLSPGGRTGGLTTQQRTSIENATVAFFLQCISCHPNNQRLMAQVWAKCVCVYVCVSLCSVFLFVCRKMRQRQI